MCGIAGYAGWPGDERLLRGMCDAIRHRGPDDEGLRADATVGLGMRRLSIIDVAGGHQPIANEDGTAHIVFNGEIYNHHELRRELERAGHRFTTASDTETILHGYEEFGDDVATRLRGMFAFAIWDGRRERLLIARDRVGIKPLYYWETADGIAFASELRSLLALDRFTPRLDHDAVAWYLALGYVPDPLCIFEGVRKLAPGHRLTWSRGEGLALHQYWSPVRPEIRIGEEEAVAELRRLLADAVRSHLESEVPLGAFLSGGLDSSTVVALMARAEGHRVRTFSIGFDDAGYNEAPHAARVAQAIGTDHTELVVRPDADRLVEGLVACFDEPFADSSALPTYLVAELARRSVTVALSGDGGDELFAGYTRYAELLRRPALPGPIRSTIGAIGRRLPQGALGRNRILDLGRSRSGRYAATVAAALDTSEGGVARADIASRVPGLDRILAPWFRSAAGRDFTTAMTLVDLQTYLPGDILTKVDRTSMAVSLEARVPLLDHPLVEFAVSLPSDLKLRDGTGKWIFRKAIAGIVPDIVLAKPKQGFAVPLAAWLRKELRHRTSELLRPESPIYEFVDPSAVRRVIEEHAVSRRDHSHLIWRLLVLDLWIAALTRGRLSTPTAPLIAAA
ncbi:MAG TPA: asparagine synthase (glutamine-hydrolyzing) [Gemmatimonadales bacterium]|nr:asparagine synthase (glutamine-hydrolyzing) [Gemmatimonadales bacterium]